MKRQLRLRLVIFIVASGSMCLAAERTEISSMFPDTYKRVHQNALKRILANDAAGVIEELSAIAKQAPEDAETHYMLAVAYARLDRADDAASSMQSAVNAGLSPARFVGGTLTGLKSLRDHHAFRQLAESYRHRPVHGPMLGCVTGQSAKVWVRTLAEADVQVIAGMDEELTDGIQSKIVRSTRDLDFTAEVPIQGLKPMTTYRYAISIDGRRGDDQVHTFRTAPPVGARAKFRIAFGGGAGYVPQNERVWDTVRSFRPDALLLLGDNVYIDAPTMPEMQHYCYYRRQARPEYARLIASTPVYAIWDDHDFGTNDCSGGPLRDIPAWKPKVWQVFCNNWENPVEGRPGLPGCWFDFHIGDVHFIMLECRYWRNPKATDNHPKSMLGPEQKQWLKDTVRKSKGKFKVLCSSVPWTFEAKGDSPDTWNGYREERNEIFDYLVEYKVDGVVLMSADRHRSDLWKIKRANGYALYEFNSSRLTNQHVHPTMPAAEFSYNTKQSFGVVDFDTTADDPTITYLIVSIDEETVFDYTLRRSQLER
jgi:alkaline phosphatase D